MRKNPNIHFRAIIRAGETGAIASFKFQKWQSAPVNFEYAQVKDKEITQKNVLLSLQKSLDLFKLLSNTEKEQIFFKR